MKHLLVAATIVGACFSASGAYAAEAKARVSIISSVSDYSFPNWTWVNQSTAGIGITNVEFFGGAPIDWIANIPPNEFSSIFNPVGGTRTLLRGEEAGFDTNNGCTNGVSYSLSGFGSGKSFRFSVDPEGGGCGTAVIDYRNSLRNNLVTAKITFDNGIVVEGNNWGEELIDPNGQNTATNQRFFLNFSQDVPDVTSAVPEPQSWAMFIIGFGLVGAVIRRAARRRTPAHG